MLAATPGDLLTAERVQDAREIARLSIQNDRMANQLLTLSGAVDAFLDARDILAAALRASKRMAGERLFAAEQSNRKG